MVVMPYQPSFDGIRAAAVLSVVAFHCRFPDTNGGFIGVDIFFVLSGFLITTILRAELRQTGAIQIGRFYYNRALRLCPPLFLMLSFYAISAPLFFPDANPASDIVLAGLYLSDYSRAFWGMPDYLSHTWSLAVEEHYYLIWPLIVLFTRRWSDRGFLAVLIGAFVAAASWRVFAMADPGQWEQIYYRFDTRLSGLILGSAISAVPRLPGRAAAAVMGPLAVCVLLIAASVLRWKSPEAHHWAAVLVDVAAAMLILSVASGRSALARILSWRPVVYVGLLSYSIYIWHYPIARLVRDQFGPSATFLIVAGASFLIAALSYEFIEKPAKTFRKRRLSAA